MTDEQRLLNVMLNCDAADPLTPSAARVVLRDILTELRKPSERMLEPVTRAIDDCYNGVKTDPAEHDVATKVWQAMIDSILQEGEE